MTIAYFQYCSDLLPIILFLLFLKKTKVEKGLWVIFFYALLSYINDNLLLFVFVKDNNDAYLLLSIFTAIEYLCFSFFLLQMLRIKVFQNIIKIASVLFLLFCLFSIVTSSDHNRFDSLQTSLSAILIIIFCIFYFYEKLNQQQMESFSTDPEFWIVVGFLIYLAATLFLYGYVTSLPEKLAAKYWFISNCGNILKNIFLSVGILLTIIGSKPNDPEIHNNQEYQPFLN